MSALVSPAEVQQASDLEFFDPIVLHYVKKTMVAESAVLGTEMRAMCGEEWTADETDYATTGRADGTSKETVICPLCAHLHSEMAVQK